jgi:sarcosine oxidase, subunit beta
VDTDRGHGSNWSGAFVDRVGEARTYARTSGRRAVRRAFSVARARLHGSAPVLRWPRASLQPTYDVVVVGGDVAGLWLAFELSELAGQRVAVLEPDLVGERWPSRARVALSELSAPPGAAALVRRSIARLDDLATERGLPLTLGRGEVLTIARDEEDLRSLARRVEALGAAPDGPPGPEAMAEIIGPERASEVVGHLDGRRVVGAALDGWATVVDTGLLPWILGGLAAANRVDIVENCSLEGLTAGPSGWELATTAGTTVSGAVVDATRGAEATRAAGLDHGCFWRCWETLLTEPVQPFLRAAIRTATCEVSQTEQGEVQLRGEAGPALSQADGFPLADAAALAADATDLLPALARLRMVAHRSRRDLMAPDGLPVAGTTGATGLLRLGGFGGQEVALAPAVAEGLAHVLRRRSPPVRLDAFAPARLAGGVDGLVESAAVAR